EGADGVERGRGAEGGGEPLDGVLPYPRLRDGEGLGIAIDGEYPGARVFEDGGVAAAAGGGVHGAGAPGGPGSHDVREDGFVEGRDQDLPKNTPAPSAEAGGAGRSIPRSGF